MSFLRCLCCKSSCYHELDREREDQGRLIDETITYAKAKNMRNGNISGQSGSTKASEPDIELQTFDQKKPDANGNDVGPRGNGDASNVNYCRIVVKKEQETESCNVIKRLCDEFVKSDQSVEKLLMSEFGAYCLRQRRKMMNYNYPDYNLFVNKMDDQMETFARENELKKRINKFLIDHVPAIFVGLLGNFLDLNNNTVENKDDSQVEQVSKDAKKMSSEKVPYAIAGQMMLDYLAYEKSEDDVEINKFTLHKDMDVELQQRLNKFAEQNVEKATVIQVAKVETVEEKPIQQLSKVETVEEECKQEVVQPVEIIRHEEMETSCIETKNETQKQPEMETTCIAVTNETQKQKEMENVCFEDIKKAEAERVKAEEELKKQQEAEAARIKAEKEAKEKQEAEAKKKQELEAEAKKKQELEAEAKKKQELEAEAEIKYQKRLARQQQEENTYHRARTSRVRQVDYC